MKPAMPGARNGEAAPDVLVLGGGMIGSATALALRDRGLSVTLVERGPAGELGREASWAAAGILSPQHEADAPGPLLSLMLAGRARWTGFAEQLQARTGIDPCLRAEGTLSLALDEQEAAQLDR